MKRFLNLAATLLALCICGAAMAAPTVYSQAYQTGPGQPASASLTVDGLSQINCPLIAANDGSVTPTCDLASLPVGVHTLVMVVTNTYGCTTGTDGNSATCTGGGTASSLPFSFTLNNSAASKPVLKFKP
jgi:hypothetical protein